MAAVGSGVTVKEMCDILAKPTNVRTVDESARVTEFVNACRWTTVSVSCAAWSDVEQVRRFVVNVLPNLVEHSLSYIPEMMGLFGLSYSETVFQKTAWGLTVTKLPPLPAGRRAGRKQPQLPQPAGNVHVKKEEEEEEEDGDGDDDDDGSPSGAAQRRSGQQRRSGGAARPPQPPQLQQKQAPQPRANAQKRRIK